MTAHFFEAIEIIACTVLVQTSTISDIKKVSRHDHASSADDRLNKCYSLHDHATKRPCRKKFLLHAVGKPDAIQDASDRPVLPAKMTMMDQPNPAQIRAARAMLDWSMVDLSRAACVSVSAVKRFEDGKAGAVSDQVVATMRDALETEGVRFLSDDGNGPGVRHARR